MNPNRCARCAVDCRNCPETFTHSEIGEEGKFIDYLMPITPEFPVDREELE